MKSISAALAALAGAAILSSCRAGAGQATTSELLPGFDLPALPGRTVAHSPEHHAKLLRAAADGSLQGGDAPAWPMAFNATLIKLVPALSSPENFSTPPLVWSRFYYDYQASPGGSARYDFHNNYVTLDSAQGPSDWPVNCSIIFNNFSIWFVFPHEQSCYHRSASIPSISPWWLDGINATFTADTTFRGMAAQQWTGTDPDNASFAMPYYGWPASRSSTGTSVPLRTTNQAADPGATDYTDQRVGSQDPTLFDVPAYCHSNPVVKGCPWW